MDKSRKACKLQDLWQETFGDSREYVDMLYGLYYDRTDNIFLLEEIEGKVAAGLVGIGYDFYDPVARKGTRGLYLCGLATNPDFRCQGLMTRLIAQAEQEAKRKGYDFCFLIPADEHLRRYYSKFGYKSEMERGKMEISQICENRKFANECTDGRKFSILVNDENYGTDRDLQRDILEFVHECERGYPGMTINHTRADLEGIVRENGLAGGAIYWLPGEALIFIEDDTVRQIFTNDKASAKKVLDTLKEAKAQDLTIPTDSPFWELIGERPRDKEKYVMVKYLSEKISEMNVNAFLLLD